MFDNGSLFNRYEVVEELSSGVSLVRSAEDGNLYVRRRYNADRTDFFEKLKKTDSCRFPKIFYVLTLSDKSTVIIEEYVHGTTLLELLTDNKLSPQQIPDLAFQLAEATGELHSNGIVHMDIKPANIIIDNSGRLRLIDFGISKLYGENIDKQADYLGTVGYAAPEQFSDICSDFRTDIYSLGVTLEKAIEITGYKGKLIKIAKRCTQCERRKRFQSIDELKKALSHKRSGKGLTALCIASVIIAVAILINFL